MTAIPDLSDNVMLMCDFALQDLLSIMERITYTLKQRRKIPGWKAEDLKALKVMRASLHPYLDKARADALTSEEHIVLQQLLNEAMLLNLCSVDDLRAAPAGFLNPR